MSVIHLTLYFWWKQKTYRLRSIKWTNERHTSKFKFLMKKKERIDCDQSDERMSVTHLILYFWWKQKTYRMRSIRWANERHSFNLIFLVRTEDVSIAINQIDEWTSLIEFYVFDENRRRIDCDQSNERMGVTHLILCFWWEQKTYRLRSIRSANERHSFSFMFLMKTKNVSIAANQMRGWASFI